MTLATSNAVTSFPQHCLTGEGGEINTILHYLQKICYDLTISLNIFCEGLLIAGVILSSSILCLILYFYVRNFLLYFYFLS